jgi:hypothetical protein
MLAQCVESNDAAGNVALLDFPNWTSCSGASYTSAGLDTANLPPEQLSSEISGLPHGSFLSV